jgi:hypothetical protein
MHAAAVAADAAAEIKLVCQARQQKGAELLCAACHCCTWLNLLPLIVLQQLLLLVLGVLLLSTCGTPLLL